MEAERGSSYSLVSNAARRDSTEIASTLTTATPSVADGGCRACGTRDSRGALLTERAYCSTRVSSSIAAYSCESYSGSCSSSSRLIRVTISPS